jgi:hypothetical protein
MRLITIAFALLAISVSVRAQPSCGDPPRVDDQTLKGDLEGKAQLLLKWVGDAGLKGQIEATRSDVFSKYTDAGKARSDNYLEYMFCSFVLSDPKLSTEMKRRAIQEYREAEREQPSPQISTSGNQSPAVISKGDTSINYGAPPLPPAPSSPAADPGQSLPAGSIHTEGSQSPAVNTGGAANIQYGAPAVSPSPPTSTR